MTAYICPECGAIVRLTAPHCFLCPVCGLEACTLRGLKTITPLENSENEVERRLKETDPGFSSGSGL